MSDCAQVAKWRLCERTQRESRQDAPIYHLMSQKGCAENDPNGPVPWQRREGSDEDATKGTKGIAASLGSTYATNVAPGLTSRNKKLQGKPSKDEETMALTSEEPEQ